MSMCVHTEIWFKEGTPIIQYISLQDGEAPSRIKAEDKEDKNSEEGSESTWLRRPTHWRELAVVASTCPSSWALSAPRSKQ